MLYSAAPDERPGSSKYCGRVSQSMAKCAGARLSSQKHQAARRACFLASALQAASFPG